MITPLPSLLVRTQQLPFPNKDGVGERERERSFESSSKFGGFQIACYGLVPTYSRVWQKNNVEKGRVVLMLVLRRNKAFIRSLLYVPIVSHKI